MGVVSAVEKFKKVTVLCSSCGHLLCRYAKRNGTQSRLIKLFHERMVQEEGAVDFSSTVPSGKKYLTEGDMKDAPWPSCGKIFARGPLMIKGKFAHKIVNGRVDVRS